MVNNENEKVINFDCNRSKFLLLYFLTFFFVLVLIRLGLEIESKIDYKKIDLSKEQSLVKFKNNIFLLINAGQKKVISSYLWVITIIQSDLEKYTKDNFESWMFLRFKMISELDPHFIDVYRLGGQYLSVIKNDLKGATYLFDKGLSLYPDDYDLNLKGGYHFYFEDKDVKKALNSLQKIKLDPRSPMHIKSLITKLFIEDGRFEVAYHFLEYFYQNEKENIQLKKRYFDQLNSLKIEMDLKCLNDGLKNKSFDASIKCEKMDLKKNYYIMKDGQYIYPESWKKLRIHKNNSIK
jgi:hypothetical protein